MIEFDIKTINNRSLGTVTITETHKYRNTKRYYDVEYADKYTTHKARVLQRHEDGVLTLIMKATKAVERVRKAFYSFPKDKVTWIAKQGGGAVCVAEEEDMKGNKSDSHGLMPVVFADDIPDRYRKFVVHFTSGGAGPLVNGRCGIYLHDLNRWLAKQFVETV